MLAIRATTRFLLRDLAGGAAALGVTQSLIDRGVMQTIDVHLRLGTHV